MLNDLYDETNAIGELYSVTACNQSLNDCIFHYAKVLESLYQGYLSTDVVINLLANVTTYNLGPTFRSPIYYVKRTLQQVIYNLFPFHTYLANKSTVPVPNNSFLPTYEMEGNNMVFSYPPAEDEPNAIIVKFPKKLVPLVGNNDPLDDQLYDAEDCIIMRSALRLQRSKDVSGALKNTAGWTQELQESEKAFFLQVGNRYIKQDVPIPTPFEDYAYY